MGAYLIATDSTGTSTTLKFDVVTDESWNGANQITEHPVETGANVADNVRVGLVKCQLTAFVTNEPFQKNSFTDVTPQQVTITVAAPDQDTVDPTLVITAQLWDNGLALRTALQGVGALAGKALGGTGGGVIGDIAGGALGQLLDPAHEKDFPFSPGVGIDPTPGQSQGINLLVPGTPDDYVARMISTLETMRKAAQLITVVGSKEYHENMVIASVDRDRSADTGTGAEIVIQLQEIRFVTTQTVAAPKPAIPRGTPPQAKGPQNPVQAPKPTAKSWALWLQEHTRATPPSLMPGGEFATPGAL